MKRSKTMQNIFIALLVAVVLLLCAYWYFQSITENILCDVMDTISRETAHSTIEIRLELEKTLEITSGFALSLTQNGAIRANVFESFNEKYNLPRFVVIDLNGNAVASDGSSYSIGADSLKEGGYFEHEVISEPFIDRISGLPIMTFSVPVYKYSELISVAGCSKYVSDLDEFLNSSFYDGKGYTLLVNKDGKVLTRPTHSDYVQITNNLFDRIALDGIDQTQLKQAKNDFANNKGGNISFDANGKTKLIAYEPLYINDWFVISVIPNFEIAGGAKNILNSTLLLFIVTTVLIIIVFIHIIAKDRRTKKKIIRLAYYDELTGISNINKFKIDATALLEKNKNTKYLLVKVDVDRFKLINNMYGFDEGNRVIQNIVAALKIVTDPELDTYGRIANDDFIVLTGYRKYDNYKKQGEDFAKNFSEINSGNDFGYLVEFSTGLYQIPMGETDINAMMEKVNMAHKVAKLMQGNRVHLYSDELRNKAIGDKELENSMRSALQNGEFVVYMQPKYYLDTLRIGGAEALVRWQNPQKGFMPPGSFIPLFEQNGFVVDIDSYILEEVCKFQRKRLDEGKSIVPVSVNQSRLHLNIQNYVGKIIDIVEKYKLPTNLIELELTESAMHENTQNLLDILFKFKKYGFIISIDDFGSGYSSLNLLKTIPADVLKIDKEFLNESEASEKGKMILGDIISLANHLHMTVVSEGIETFAQEAMLRELKCHMVQGYLYSKPIPITDYEKLLDNQL